MCCKIADNSADDRHCVEQRIYRKITHIYPSVGVNASVNRVIVYLAEGEKSWASGGS